MYYSLVNIDESIVITLHLKYIWSVMTPSPAIELPVRNAKVAWGLMQFHRKTTVLPEVTVGIGHAKTCSIL